MALTPNDQATGQGGGWTDSLSDNIFSVYEIVLVCGFYLKRTVKDLCPIFQLSGYIYLYLVFESERGMGRGSDEPFFYWASL